MTNILIKSIGVWLLLLLFAILNGGLREKLLVPYLGQQWAQSVSVLLLSIIIFLTTFVVFSFIGITNASQAWLIGGVWVILTVIFEFLFGHYIAGDSWKKLMEAYQIWKGELWILDIIATLISPYLAGKARGVF